MGGRRRRGREGGVGGNKWLGEGVMGIGGVQGRGAVR